MNASLDIFTPNVYLWYEINGMCYKPMAPLLRQIGIKVFFVCKSYGLLSLICFGFFNGILTKQG